MPIPALFLSLAQSVWRTRAFGDFWSHVLVAEGAVDVSAEPEVSLWDLAALQVIVEEAGGKASRFDGSPFELDSRETLASNGLIHDALVREFQEIFAGRGLDPLPDPRVYQR